MRNILLHLHPSKVSERSLTFHRTFGLGGIAAMLIVVLIITGILLRFYYIPSPAEAYNSVVFLKQQVLFGPFVRNIHYWSGVFLLMTVFLHFLRVFFTGAYRDGRKINWLFGLLILAIVVLSNFTGYLLPWDQLAYWAITVSTNITGYFPVFGESLRMIIIGGKELNAGTLQSFFALHSALLPFMLLVLVFYHFWRVRKSGGIMLPDSENKGEMLPVMPNLVYREFIAALVLIAAVFLFGALVNAPLLEKANPAFSMNPTKAPWYFAGVQELLMHFHPFFAAFIIPVSTLAFLAWIPFIPYDRKPSGHWFISGKGKHSATATAVFAVVVTLGGILFNAYVLNFEIMMPGMPAFISNGLIPLCILVLLTTAFYRIYLKGLRLSTEEKVQALFVFIVVSFIILTLCGIFFRGKDMALALPWNV